MDSYSDSNRSYNSSVSLSNISSIQAQHINQQNLCVMSCTNIEDLITCDGPLHSTLNYPLNSTQLEPLHNVPKYPSSPRVTTVSRQPSVKREAHHDVLKHTYSTATKNNIKRKMKRYRKEFYKNGLTSFHMLAVV